MMNKKLVNSIDLVSIIFVLVTIIGVLPVNNAEALERREQNLSPSLVSGPHSQPYDIGSISAVANDNLYYWTLAPDVIVKGPILNQDLMESENSDLEDSKILKYWIDKSYLSLDQNQTSIPENSSLEKKIFEHQTLNYLSPKDYVRLVFGYLVQSASQRYRLAAKDASFEFDPNGDYNWSYYSWILANLVIFQHESKLMQFRSSETDFCHFEKNEQLILPPQNTAFNKKSGKETTYDILKRVLKSLYKKTDRTIIPSCDQIKNFPYTTQVLTSTNHQDFGFVQMNMYWHPDILKPLYSLNLYNTIDYGSNFLLHKFMQLKDIYQNKKFKACQFDYNPFTRQAETGKPFYNFIRALWSGGYNHGDLHAPSKTCRYNIESDHTVFDDQFKDSLDAILMENTSIYHRYLQPGTFERTVLDEIIHNFRKIYNQSQYNKEMKQNLLTLLESNSYKSISGGFSDSFYIMRPQQNPNHIVTANEVNFRRIIYRDSDSLPLMANCGSLQKDELVRVTGEIFIPNTLNKNTGKLDILNSQGENPPLCRKWYMITFPKYSQQIGSDANTLCKEDISAFSPSAITDDRQNSAALLESIHLPGILDELLTTETPYYFACAQTNETLITSIDKVQPKYEIVLKPRKDRNKTFVKFYSIPSLTIPPEVTLPFDSSDMPKLLAFEKENYFYTIKNGDGNTVKESENMYKVKVNGDIYWIRGRDTQKVLNLDSDDGGSNS